MKRAISVVLALCLGLFGVFMLAACGRTRDGFTVSLFRMRMPCARRAYPWKNTSIRTSGTVSAPAILPATGSRSSILF